MIYPRAEDIGVEMGWFFDSLVVFNWISKDVVGLNIRAGCSIDTWYS